MTDRALARHLYLVVFVAYAWFFGGGGWGENAHFALTRAIVERGTVDVQAYASTTGDLAQTPRGIFINKPPGLSLLAVPPYAAAYHLERLIGIDPAAPLAVTINVFIVNLATSVALGALIPPLIFLHARRRGASRRFALSLALIAAFATQLWGLSSVFLLHVASAATMMLAFYTLDNERKRVIAFSGFAAGVSAITNYMAVPVFAAFAVYVLFSRRGDERVKRLAAFVAGGVVPLAAFMLYQLTAFGAVFRLPIAMNERFVTRDAWLGVLNPPSLDALWGITFSPFRGLFYVSPILVLAIVGIAVVLYRRAWGEAWKVGMPVAVHFAINLTFNNWDGGFGVGARYLSPVTPFLALLLLDAKIVHRTIWIALTIISLLNNFAIVAVDPQPNGSFNDPLGEYVYPLLLTGRFSPSVPLHPSWSPELVHGHTSVVRHTFEEAVPFTKHRPGSPVTEWASFNFGELITGPGRLLSLVPIVVFLAAAITLLMRRAAVGDE